MKYKTKPEKRSETYKDMMKELVKTTDVSTQSMAGMCASLMNVLSGNRDFGDVETCHQLNQLELMKWSRVFSGVFQMDGRTGLAKPAEEAEEDGARLPRKPAEPEKERAFTKSVETWYVQRPEELEDLTSFELLARYDNTGGKYHRLTVGPPIVPHYAPFLEAKHSVPPGEFKIVDSAKDLATSTRKHEEYCEQRLVMFRPYRQRLQLLDGHKNFTEAMLAWLAEKGSDRGKETVQYELKVTRHRLQLVEEFQLQFGEPGEHIDDESDSEGEMEADGTADNNDPLVALFGARPPTGGNDGGGNDGPWQDWEDDVHRASKDWSASAFDLSALFEGPADKEGWLLRCKLNLGDDAVASGLLDYSIFNMAHLNVEQRFAYEIVTRHAELTLLALHDETSPPAPLFLTVDGCGGTGKSHVLHCIARYIRERATELGLPDPLCISAFSGSAAEQIFGQTIHSLYGLDVGVPFSESVGPKRKLALETRLGNKWYHLFDERSMISQIMWGWIIARMRVACPERKDLKFSGRSVVLFGDDCQLPPPNGGRIFTMPPAASPAPALASTTVNPTAASVPLLSRGKGGKGKGGGGRGRGKGGRGGQVFVNNYRNEAHVWYKSFDTVVQLVQNVRAKGSSAAQLKYRTFLLDCLRACNPRLDNGKWYRYWKRTNELTAFSPQQQAAFKSGFWFCSTNETCNKHNKEMLLKCGEPIALLRAEYPKGNAALGKRGSQKDAAGLLPELALCVGAMVIYKVNSWTSRGVVHGLLCRVVEIVYKLGERPLGTDGPGTDASLPLVIFVEALGYKGPSYEHPDVSERDRRPLGYRGIFPVLPVERSWNVKNVEVTRRMMPLELGWARSVHKSQGCTAGPDKPIPFYLLDIGNIELSAGLSYVGASRAVGPTVYAVANTEAGYAFPTEKRFNNIGADGSNQKKEIDLRLRRQESQRLSRLATSTRERHAELFAYCEREVAALAAAAGTQSEAPEEPFTGPETPMEENSDEDIWEEPEEQSEALEEPFTGPEAPMEENLRNSPCPCLWNLRSSLEENLRNLRNSQGQAPTDEDMWVEFDMEDVPITSCTYDPLDAEMFPPETFGPPETFLFKGSEESDAGASEEDTFEAQGFEGSDAGASEESFTSVQEEEGADSDIELFEEPPLGTQFRY